MSVKAKAVEEAKEFTLAALFFSICFLILVVLKKLILAQYEVGFYGLSAALVGALIVAKVVIVLQHVPLGAWVKRRPVLLDVFLRTLLYSIGVMVAVLLERSIEQRHEHGGIGKSLVAVISERNLYQVGATTIAVGGTIMIFNMYLALRRRFGQKALTQLFLAMPAGELKADNPG